MSNKDVLQFTYWPHEGNECGDHFEYSQEVDDMLTIYDFYEFCRSCALLYGYSTNLVDKVFNSNWDE